MKITEIFDSSADGESCYMEDIASRVKSRKRKCASYNFFLQSDDDEENSPFFCADDDEDPDFETNLSEGELQEIVPIKRHFRKNRRSFKKSRRFHVDGDSSSSSHFGSTTIEQTPIFCPSKFTNNDFNSLQRTRNKIYEVFNGLIPENRKAQSTSSKCETVVSSSPASQGSSCDLVIDLDAQTPLSRQSPQTVVHHDKVVELWKPQIQKDTGKVIQNEFKPPLGGVLDTTSKIPRPPNAFMIFANEWRKHIAKQYPGDSNKAISIRLGQHWKILDQLQKEKYYQKAKRQDSEHKLRYPDYSYNPKEARARKAQREAIKTAQRQASNTVHSSPQHPHVGYRSSINSSSRPEMSPNTPFIPTYPPSPNLGQNRGSLSGGGIINASTPRPPAVSTPKRRPPPPPYPGQRNFHSMDSSREFSMGYGESGFSSLPTIYPSNQNGPQSEHQPGMFDIRFPANEPRPGLWNEMQQNSWNNSYEMQRPMQPNIDYPMQQDQSSNSILSSSNNGLEDPIYGSAEFNPDMYNTYNKNADSLNILTPKNLNTSTEIDDKMHSKENIHRPLDQYPPSDLSMAYNQNLYKHDNLPLYHAKMSPKPHCEETRMSPYNRPMHSPKTHPEKHNYRMSPKMYEASPKGESKKSPKTHKIGRSSPSFRFGEHLRKSPKTITEHQPPPAVEKHPLPAFTKAFSGTERGRLLATPENNLVNTNSSDPMSPTNAEFEFLNMDLFSDENKINFDEINELNSSFADNNI